MTVAGLPEAERAIEQRLRANWTLTPIAVQNVPFDPHEPGGSWPPDGPWVYLEVLWVGGDYVGMGDPGNNLHRTPGGVVVHVFVPSGTGDGQAVRWCKQIAEIFRGQRHDGMLFRGSQMGGGEAADDKGLWWRRSITIGVQADEFG